MSKESTPLVLETGGNITGNAQSLVFPIHSFTTVSMYCSGTFAGVNCAFEVSLNSTDGVNGTWLALSCARNNVGTIESATGVLGAAPAYFWEAYVAGARFFRIRSTAFTSGTQTWNINFSSSNVDPAPTVVFSGTPVVTPNTAVTVHALNSAATTNLTSVKATAGTLYTLHASNNGAGVAFLKLYNKASAPVLASDVPLMIIPIPAAGFVHLPLPTLGKRFTTGIAYAITGLIADTDATAVAAGQVKVAMDYI